MTRAAACRVRAAGREREGSPGPGDRARSACSRRPAVRPAGRGD